MSKLKDIFKLKNGYSHPDRDSFALFITKCRNEEFNLYDSTCKDDTVIDSVLKHLMFTVYYLEENIEFGNADNYGQRPMVINDLFHS